MLRVIWRLDCFVVPIAIGTPRNDVIAKPTKEGEAISKRGNQFNMII
jgi:hypothetical protein